MSQRKGIIEEIRFIDYSGVDAEQLVKVYKAFDDAINAAVSIAPKPFIIDSTTENEEYEQ